MFSIPINRLTIATILLLSVSSKVHGAVNLSRPNFVLCMTDDQGWGDTGYNGHPHLKTPVLDAIALTGLRFDRFYAAHPVCSPTRGSVMTGRHPNRYGYFGANWCIRPQEVTLAEVVKQAGYATGHFGKWHLGPTRAGTPVNPGGCGFDQWLSWDNFFDLNPRLNRNGAPSEQFEGEGSLITVDAALRFIRQCAHRKQPFLAIVWFGSPHTPLEALPEDMEPYRHLGELQMNYCGELAAVDRAMDKLRKGLSDIGDAGNTLLWFNSDNGAQVGSSGGLTGKKGSLLEGGIRVPGLVEWPAKIRQPMTTQVPCSTLDIYPTVVDILNIDVEGQIEPIDGISLLPLFEGKMTARPQPMGFWKYPSRTEQENESYLDTNLYVGEFRTFRNFKHPVARTRDFTGEAAWIDNRYKLRTNASQYLLFDIFADPTETHDLAAEKTQLTAKMMAELKAWQASVEQSLSGQDYGL
jgi:arylsulfatase A-like enzyme